MIQVSAGPRGAGCCPRPAFSTQKGLRRRVSSASFLRAVPAGDGIDNLKSSSSILKASPDPPFDVDRLKAILLDVDGTVAASDPLHFEVFREILIEVGFNHGKAIDEEFFRRHISGRHNPDICKDLFPTWTVTRAQEFAEEKEARYRSLAKTRLQPMPGLQRLCAWADARGLCKAAVTNADRPNAELMLDVLHLSNFFDLLVIGGECTRAKPFPDPYETALRRFNVAPNVAVIVEDSPSGLQAGVAAGVPCVGIASGQEPSVLVAAGAVMVIKDFNDPALWRVLEPNMSYGGASYNLTPCSP